MLVILAAGLTLADSNNVQMCYVDHGTTTQASALNEVIDVTSVSTGTTQYTGLRCTYDAVVTGLTPGTQYTWDLAWRYGGSTVPAYLNGFADNGVGGSNNAGPAVLTAYVA